MARVFLSPEVSLSLEPVLFELLFRAFGYPASLDKKKRQDAAAIARALFGGEVPSELAEAIAALVMLATASGRDALCEAAADARAQGHFEDGGIDRALDAAGAPVTEWAAMAPAELALRLVVARAREDALETVFERAHHRLGRSLPACIPYELAARTPGDAWASVVARGDLVADAVRAAALALGAVQAPWVAHDEDGALHVAVPRAGAVDLLRLDARQARLTIATRRPQLVLGYAAAIGRATSADPDALIERPALTLKKLQLLGAAGFGALRMPRPVLTAEVVALQLDDLRGRRIESRGRQPLAELSPKLRAGGYLVRATLRFEIAAAPHPVDAYIELPNRLSVSDPRFEKAVRAALVVLGVFSPGAHVDDLTTLPPWVHPAWRWRDVVGAKMEGALVRANLLVRVAPAAASESGTRVAREEDRSLGGNLRGFPLRNARDKGTQYAVAADWAVPARTVVPREMWKLDMRARRARMRAAMGLSRGEKLELPNGVGDVGRLVLRGGVTLRFVEIVRAVGERETKKLARMIRRALGAEHAVVLLGEGKTLGAVLAEVSLDLAQQLGIGDYDGVVMRAAKEVGVEGSLEPSRFATKEAPMVIAREAQEVWLGRVRLLLTDNQFAMLLALAQASGQAMKGTALGEKISARAADLAQIVHNTRRDFAERVERSFREAGVALPEEWAGDWLVVSAGSRSYRLGVGCLVR